MARFGRTYLAMTACAAALVAGPALAEETRTFDIPAQAAATAIPQFVRQSGLNVGAAGADLNGLRTREVRGRMTPDEALQRLLAGTGLVTRPMGERSVILVRAEPIAAPVVAVPAPNLPPTVVVVTATKRNVELQKLPMAVSVVGERQIDDLNAQGFDGYFRSVPGLMVNKLANGQFDFSIRGVSSFHVAQSPSANVDSTVSVYVDEIPVTLTDSQLDMRLIDLNRVEVLKGPQGTYYGEAALGGTIRIITKKPDLQNWRAVVEGRLSQTEGHSLNDSEAVMINAPLIPGRLGLRVNHFEAFDSGYINEVDVDPMTGFVTGIRRKRYNPIEANGTRATLLLRLNDSAYLTGEVVHTASQASNIVGYNPTLGDLLTPYCRSSGGPAGNGLPVGPGVVTLVCYVTPSYSVTSSNDLGNITLNADLGWASLVSTSSWATRRSELATPDPQQASHTSAFAQEVRLASSKSWSQTWEYTAGLFYQNKKPVLTSRQYEVPGGPWTDSFNYRSFAAFVDVGYRFDARWNLHVGARQEWLDDRGHFDIPSLAAGDFTLHFKPVTGRVVLTRIINDDMMMYASASRGFRNGGINEFAAGSPAIPATYDPDTVTNYELGWKLAFGGKARLNGAVYHVDWRNTQVVLNVPDSSYGTYHTNAGQSVVDGLELEGSYEFMPGLSAQATMSLIDSRLAEDFELGGPGVSGKKGDRMPFVAGESGSLSLNYRHGWRNGKASTFAILNTQYQGPRQTDFNDGNADYLKMRAYWLVGAQLGVENRDWRAALYVDNLLNVRSEVSRQFHGKTPVVITDRPRTLGIFLRRAF